MCAVLGVQRCNYYRWSRQEERRREREQLERPLIKNIEKAFVESNRIDTELVKRALAKAMTGRRDLEGLIFHSNRGSQYVSKGFQKVLEENGITMSMSRPGCPYDNSSIESFFATLKKERIYRREYSDISDFNSDMFRFIELFYNRKRRHSKLN